MKQVAITLVIRVGCILMLGCILLPQTTQAGCCGGLTGNIDCDPEDDVTGADLATLIDHLFISQDPLCCFEEAALDILPQIDGADLAVLIDHLFISLSPNLICPDAPNPWGDLVEIGECTHPWLNKADPPSHQGCVEWNYDNGTLHLTHWNAGFNCCPEIHTDVWVGSSHIWIEETETFPQGDPCPCLCVYDLEFEINNLPPGEYIIDIEELYLEAGDAPLYITIDLITEPVGISCADRNHYPWTEM